MDFSLGLPSTLSPYSPFSLNSCAISWLPVILTVLGSCWLFVSFWLGCLHSAILKAQKASETVLMGCKQTLKTIFSSAHFLQKYLPLLSYLFRSLKFNLFTPWPIHSFSLPKSAYLETFFTFLNWSNQKQTCLAVALCPVKSVQSEWQFSTKAEENSINPLYNTEHIHLINCSLWQ